MPGSPRYHELKARKRELALSTVCEEARCPNIGECWGGGTATFMVMGDTCTRGCRFCAVKTLKQPAPLDPNEPTNLAEVVAELDLDYVVLTSVDRDDLEDGGAAHFAACIEAIHARTPKTLVEVLIPDYLDDALHAVVDTHATVVAHNIETVERLQGSVRDRKASYARSMAVLRGMKARRPGVYTKSSIMVGVGETEAEVVQTMRDLRAEGCDFLTLGQYLQPSPKHLPVIAFVTPEQFDGYAAIGKELGFGYVASGPLVRSSYRAGEYFIREVIEAGRQAQ